MDQDPAARQDAREQSRLWSRGATAATAASVLGEALHAETGVTFAAIAVLLQALSQRADALAEDPPDHNFRSRVTLPPRLLRDVPAQSEDMAQLILAMNDAVAFLEATVRAYERAQGAARRKDMESLLLRLDEARRYADGAYAELLFLPAAVPAVRSFTSEGFDGDWPTTPSAETLIRLYEMRLPPDEIESAFSGSPAPEPYAAGTSPWEVLASTLERIPLADPLRDWLRDRQRVVADLW